MGVYTIAGGKGGVGKSTTTASLGIALYDAGFDVALVDADLAMANLADVFGVEADQGVHQVLAGEASVQDVLVEVSAGFYLVPGAKTLGSLGDSDAANLQEVVAPLAGSVDVVLVDTGAGLGHETLVAAGLADGVVVVSTPTEAALDDVARTVEFVDHADADVLGSVITRVDNGTDVGAVSDRLDVPVLGTVPADPTIGTDPVTTGDAGAAYRRLAATVVEVSGETAATVRAPASVAWRPDMTESTTASKQATCDQPSTTAGRLRALFPSGD